MRTVSRDDDAGTLARRPRTRGRGRGPRTPPGPGAPSRYVTRAPSFRRVNPARGGNDRVALTTELTPSSGPRYHNGMAPLPLPPTQGIGIAGRRRIGRQLAWKVSRANER
jgi:hypothetical protein